jgi:hypothetical protein
MSELERREHEKRRRAEAEAEGVRPVYKKERGSMGNYGTAPNRFWLDWTRYQGAINASRIADEGFGGVFLKTSGAAARPAQGLPADPFHLDPYFAVNAPKLAAEPRLLRGAFHYLVPGYETQQAFMLYGQLRRLGGPQGWVVEADIEEPGLQLGFIQTFCATWGVISDGYPLLIYTRRNYWTGNFGGASLPTPYLHEAHWVPDSVRNDDSRPYASQQAHAIQPEYWNGYGGVSSPLWVQFTNRALVDSRRVDASLSGPSRDEIAATLIRS